MPYVRIGRVGLICVFAALAILQLTSDAIEKARQAAQQDAGLAEPAPGSMFIGQIAPTASAIFGIGSRQETHGRMSFHLWRSDGDGTWHIADKEGALGAPADVVVAGDRIVVVGTDGSAAVWSARLGDRSWQRVEARRGRYDGDIHKLGTIPNDQLQSVTHGPPGFVAVGQVEHPDGRTLPVAMVSPDGLRWETVNLPVPGGDSPLRSVRMERVTFTGTGFVAFGRDPMSSRAQLLWRSSDGVSWEPLTLTFEGSAAGDRPYIRIVGAGPDGLLAAGTTSAAGPGRPQPMVWSSKGGDHWAPVPTAGYPAPRGLIQDLIFVDGTWIAVGRFTGESGNVYGAMASTDGQRWDPVAVPASTLQGPSGIAAAAIVDGHLVLVGSTRHGTKDTPVLVNVDVPPSN